MSSKSNKTSKGIKLFKSRRSQIVFCGVGLLISVLFLLMQFGLNFNSMIPSAASKKKLEGDREKLEKEKQELQSQLDAQQTLRNIADSKFNGAWIAREHGRPEVELRTLLQNAAKKLDLTVTSLSPVRKSNFNKDLSMLEVDVNLTSDLEILTKFWQETANIKPALYWKKFECRMSFMYGVMAVNFNGTLRCVYDERRSVPNVAQKSGGNK